jgi:NUDIX domain
MSWDTSVFTDADQDALIELLAKLRAAGKAVPRMPRPLFYALRGVAALTAVEILIEGAPGQVLLTWREDQHWSGWHLPGGFVAPFETLADACARVSDRELGQHVVFDRVLTAEGWRDHPYASVVSIVCLCQPTQPITVGRCFSGIPEQLIEQHRPFLEAYFARFGQLQPTLA